METPRANGCNGGCCVEFPIGSDTYAEFLERARQPRNLTSELPQIAAMIIHIRDSPRGSAIYNCRNFDPATRLCTAYEKRPPMCSTYPYEEVCKYCWLRLSQINGLELAAPEVTLLP